MDKRAATDSGHQDRKLRFLFISSDKYVPFRMDVAHLFGEEIVGRGHVIDWILQSEKDCPGHYQTTWSGCRVWVGATHNGDRRAHRLYKHLLGLANDLRVFKLARKHPYDFIQVKDKFLSACPALFAARLFNRKFVYWLSYPFPEASIIMAGDGTARYPFFYYFRGLVFRFLLYRVILPEADAIFVQSEQMKRDVMAEGLPEGRIMPVPMGVSLNEIEAFRMRPPELKTSWRSGKTIVYLGTLTRVRRLDFLIRVLHRVSRRHQDVRLMFVGSGDDAEDEDLLRREAEKWGVADRVVITGFLPKAKALAHVVASDVCVSPFFPSPILLSTSPTKLIEYMAMGKAVVANDHPEQKLVIRESGGGICVGWDEGEFADAISGLLSDPDRVHQMGEDGRRYVQAHRSYKAIADKVEAAYRTLMTNE